MKTFILEDNQSSRELFKKYLAEDSPEVQLIGEAASLKEARAFFEKQSPELALFDIDLPDGTSFELLQELIAADRVNFDLIFITAFGTQEYIIQALEFSALKYLTKPLNRHELRSAIAKALDRHQDKVQLSAQIGQLLNNTRQSPTLPPPANLAIPTLKGAIEMVRTEAIIYISSYQEGTMTQIHLKGHDHPLSCTRSIGQFKKILANNANFFQIHQSYIINTDAMTRFDPSESAVTMSNGKVLFASRQGKSSLRKHLLGEEDPGQPELDEKGLIGKVWKLLGRA